MDTKQLIEDVLIDLGNNKSLTEVSSKVQIIVRLLGDDTLKSWYNCEFIKGYDNEDLPSYRVSRAADIKADYFVPHGFGLLQFKGQSVPVENCGLESYEEIMSIRIKDTISSIIEYSKKPKDIGISLTPNEKYIVQRVLSESQIQNVYKVPPPSLFQTILDSVKGRIIDLFMDLNDKVFNGEIDIKSQGTKADIHNVINNYFTAGLIQSGSGSIEIANSTIAARIDGALNQKEKDELLELANRIEALEKDTNEEYDEIAQSIVEIKNELESATPRNTIIKNAFRAIAWLASTATKSAIEELVKNAIRILQ